MRIIEIRNLCTLSLNRVRTTTPDARIIKTGFNPNTCRLNFQLKHVVERGQLCAARQLYDKMPEKNTVSTNLMIWGYAKWGHLSSARLLFDSMLQRSVVSWTILIGAYSETDQFVDGLMLFGHMIRCGARPDYVTFASLLCGCNHPNMVNELFQLHALVVKLGHDSAVIVCNSLIDSYCKMQLLCLARTLFDEMPRSRRDSVTYNALLTGCVKNGSSKEAVQLFTEMQSLGLESSDFTFQAVLYAGIGLDDGTFGEQIHCLALKNNLVTNVFVGNALLDFYSKHDCIDQARRLFDEMSERDGVSHNIIITAYSWVGHYEECIRLFKELQFASFDRRNFPFATMLSIASNTVDLRMGQQIHGQATVTAAASEVFVANALLDTYAKCGRFEEAKRIFLKLDSKSSIPWTSMISAKVQWGFHEEGLKLFNEMRRADASPDQATFASVLKAASDLASISLGKQLHSCVVMSGFVSNVHCESAIMDMYANCGSIKDAIQTFQQMPEKNVVSWNVLMSAYARNGEGKVTLESFEDMVRSGCQPDSVSFLCVLSACSHCGLVQQGLDYFDSMTNVYNIQARREHYVSLVDVLCRSARFDRAGTLIDEMAFEGDEVLWSSVLNSCRIHKNNELGKRAAQELFKMEVLKDGASYVTMSSMLAEQGEWGSVGVVKKAMRDRGVRKVSGHSWVEIKHKVHVFSASDNNHPQMKEIVRNIEDLYKQMEREE